MSYEREDYMRRQDAEHDMIRMRDSSRSVARPVVAPQQPRAVQPAAQPADAFRNMFAILHNLEDEDLEGSGIITSAAQWTQFNYNLTAFVLKLDDARLDALYSLVQAKQPERYRGIV